MTNFFNEKDVKLMYIINIAACKDAQNKLPKVSTTFTLEKQKFFNNCRHEKDRKN